MSDITLTRADLAVGVHRALGLSRRESAEIVEGLLEEMTAALVRGEEVKLSRFGVFSAHGKGQRLGRNPKTGQEVPIAPRRVVRFHASQMLKATVDGEEG